MAGSRPLCVSRLRHDKVVYIEVVRGAGIDRKGDLVTVAVKQGTQLPFFTDIFGYYARREVTVNMYRLAEKITSIELKGLEALERGAYRVEEKESTWRLEFTPGSGSYPSLVIEIIHYGCSAGLRIYPARGR